MYINSSNIDKNLNLNKIQLITEIYLAKLSSIFIRIQNEHK